MRIGIDMLAVQSPSGDAPGYGRFGRLLTEALLARDDGHRFVLYAHDDLPADLVPTAPDATLRTLATGRGEATGCMPHRLDRLVRTNPDRLDVLLVLDPFASWTYAHPPARPTHGVKLAAVVHGLERFLDQDPIISDPGLLRDYRRLDELRRYDLLLAASEAARDDVLKLLGLPPGRVAVIGAADDAPQLRPSAERASIAIARLGSGDRAGGFAPTRRIRVDRARPSKPRIAFFSPLPPKKSGIADYSASLIAELSRSYEIDLFHDSGYVPELALASDDVFACDARLFGRYAAGRDYRGIVHQMGNSLYHCFHYDWLTRLPGIVTLHDLTVVGFHLVRGKFLGREREFIRDELLRWYPEHEGEIRAVLRRWEGDWDELALSCARRGWSLNREILDVSRRVIVHSPWCVDQVRATTPRYAERMTVIPMGARPLSVTAERKAEIRARFGLPHDALIVASFGFVGPGKLLDEAARAFASVADSDPSALYLLVGEDGDGGLTRRSIEATGRAERIRFLGRRSIEDFHALIAVTDLGINLRRPPTNGETSAALLSLLAAGVPTIVTDVGTFADYPDRVVNKVRWDSDGFESLRRAMLALASDPDARRALGRRAWTYVRETHDWSRVAELYARVIEECHRERVATFAAGRRVQLRLPGEDRSIHCRREWSGP